MSAVPSELRWVGSRVGPLGVSARAVCSWCEQRVWPGRWCGCELSAFMASRCFEPCCRLEDGAAEALADWERWELEAERVADLRDAAFEASEDDRRLRAECEAEATLGGLAPQTPRSPQTRVVHCKHEPYDVYIGRPSPWGNPFRIGRDGTRKEVIAKYVRWLAGQPELLAKLPELKGKVLGCWCKPQACHGDYLAELANFDQLPF